MEQTENFFERMARERNITVEEMKKIISERIEQGLHIPTRKSVNRGRLFPAMAKFLRRRNG